MSFYVSMSRFGRPEDEKAFREWLETKPFHTSWPLDDIARVATRGLNGDDDLNVSFAADSLWDQYCAETAAK